MAAHWPRGQRYIRQKGRTLSRTLQLFLEDGAISQGEIISLSAQEPFNGNRSLPALPLELCACASVAQFREKIFHFLSFHSIEQAIKAILQRMVEAAAQNASISHSHLLDRLNRENGSQKKLKFDEVLHFNAPANLRFLRPSLLFSTPSLIGGTRKARAHRAAYRRIRTASLERPLSLTARLSETFYKAMHLCKKEKTCPQTLAGFVVFFAWQFGFGTTLHSTKREFVRKCTK